jgi:hypothetical protein
LITFDTVGTDTPADSATSAIVADPGLRLEDAVLEITTSAAYRNFLAAPARIRADDTPSERRQHRPADRA